MLALYSAQFVTLCRTFVAFFAISIVFNPNAAGSEITAKDIIDQMEDLYRGNTSQSAITMRIETPHYQRQFLMEAWSMGREKSLIRIQTPKKDRGISTLKRDDEMWNFFPKINKVIKIPPSMMMGSWMGSDFTNDDLVKESSLTEDYRLELTETIDYYNIILIPHELTVTVWGKIEYQVDKELMIPVKQIFYDERLEKIRVLAFLEPRYYNGRLLPSTLEMKPLNKPGNKTSIIYESIVFDPGNIDDDFFSLRNLKKRF